MDYKIIAILAVSAAIVASVPLYFVMFEQQTQRDATERLSFPQPVYVMQNQSKFFEGTNELKKISNESELREVLIASSIGSSFFNDAVRFMDNDLIVTAVPTMQSEPRPEPEPRGGFQGNTGSNTLEESLELAQRSVADSSNLDYSTTNVQVMGVDEPDFIKNDDKYVYIVSRNILTIIDAYPPESAKTVLKVALDVESNHIEDIFLNGDRLLLFYQDRDYRQIIPQFEFEPYRQSYRVTNAMILDVSDKTDPKTIHNYSIDGRLQDSRMIGDHVYFVTNNGVDYQYPIMPRIAESSRIIVEPDVFYFDNYDEFSNIVTLTSVNLFEDEINSESYLMGHTGTIYASENAFYLTYQQNPPAGYYEALQQNRFFDVVVPLLPTTIQDKINEIKNDSSLDWFEKWRQISDVMQDEFNKMDGNTREQLFEKIRDNLRDYDFKVQQELRQTVIHKIKVNDGKMQYHSKGSVPGWLLNQFSMDEDRGMFRIATTNEFYDRQEGRIQYNSVYVLDENMDTVGELEKIALDERIYSARFMGDRLYLVTFKQVDPFFVIDLSTTTPKILGELKIPGFSNYLHPYDDEHIIGIGRDTKETSSGRVQQLGIKIALFDVTDVKNPTVVDDVIIGDHRTHSEALNDHKAFFFDRQKQLLSIPVQSDLDSLGMVIDDFNRRGDWYGYYVFDINETGFELNGKITHSVGDYAFSDIQPRSFYIGDVLYTTSDFALKMNDVQQIEDEINSVKLKGTGKIIAFLD